MKKKRKFFKLLAGLVISIVLLIGIAYGYMYFVAGKIGKLKTNTSNVGQAINNDAPHFSGKYVEKPYDINDDAQNVEEIALQSDTKHITNFLLLGVDNPDKSEYLGHTDSIMIMSINTQKDSQSIKLVSLLRDTYVPIQNMKSQKINAAFFFGGHELLQDTIKQQFRIDIDKVVAVNFEAYKMAVNKIGGVNIYLSKSEAVEIGVGTTEKEYELNGEQALAYARIRRIGNDWGRTERHRKVIEALMAKAKTKNVFELNSMLGDVLPEIYTNMDTNEIVSYMPKALIYMGYPLNQEHYYPTLDSFDDPYISGVGRCIVMKDQVKTVLDLHHLIYD